MTSPLESEEGLFVTAHDFKGCDEAICSSAPVCIVVSLSHECKAAALWAGKKGRKNGNVCKKEILDSVFADLQRN
jgi:hypothetical protein